MDVGQSTTLRAGNPAPSDMEVDIDYLPVSPTDQSECPAGGGLRSSGESSRRVTVTLMGCVEGTATVRLLASGDRHELDTVAITIMSNGTVTLTPADPMGTGTGKD